VAVHPVARAGRRIRLRPVAFGLQQSVFPIRIGEILLLVIALSMLLTPLAFIASDWIAQRLGNEAKHEDGEADEIRRTRLDHHRGHRAFRAGREPHGAGLGVQDRGAR
jgi:Ni/Co efflux regulator RcnB